MRHLPFTVGSSLVEVWHNGRTRPGAPESSCVEAIRLTLAGQGLSSESCNQTASWMGFQFLPSRLSIIIDIRYDIPLITVHVFCFRPCDFAAAGGHGRAPEASPGNAAAAAPGIASAAGRGRAPEAAPVNAAAAAPVFAAATERDQAPNAAPGIAAAGERGQALNAAPGNAAAPGIAPATGGRGRAPNAAPANAAAPGIAAAAGRGRAPNADPVNAAAAAH
ncbi:nischarin-like [Daphnia pulex]|uniref:nischarin-like n=1 Tax=Daphnia pulex TaxID=6669 RepID=UPI001EDF8FA0|nr:nischarin-like [Daphnia pulex]